MIDNIMIGVLSAGVFVAAFWVPWYLREMTENKGPQEPCPGSGQLIKKHRPGSLSRCRHCKRPSRWLGLNPRMHEHTRRVPVSPFVSNQPPPPPPSG